MKPDSQHQILVVDDEPQVRNLIASFLRNEGYAVETAECGEEACRMISAADDGFDVVFTDLRMPRGNGLDVLRHIRRHSPRTLGVVVTGYGTFESAIEALRIGAFDYLTKPIHLEEIRRLARKALEHVSAASLGAGPSPAVATPLLLSRSSRVKTLVGRSQPMQTLKALIAAVAPSGSTVLIRGESGTGKELVAQALHDLSPRASNALIPVNCGAIPEDLLESELFGHVKGSFTGAMNDRVGRFVMADGGTIFLDEIGDMSPKLQVKVLRVLQEQYVEPVGSTETIRVNVRILAATNVDLEKAVEEKRFREDLYYRLNVIPIHVPPLRDRLEDVPLLVEHFTKIFNQKQPRKLDGFSEETLEVLRNYEWPGNVRELENLVERMTILSRASVVTPDDLPEKFHGARAALERRSAPLPDYQRAARAGSRGETADGAENDGAGAFSARIASGPSRADGLLPQTVLPAAAANLSDMVDRFEREMIVKALQRSNGVKNRAAQILGIKRTTLVEKMKKKNIVFKRV